MKSLSIFLLLLLTYAVPVHAEGDNVPVERLVHEKVYTYLQRYTVLNQKGEKAAPLDLAGKPAPYVGVTINLTRGHDASASYLGNGLMLTGAHVVMGADLRNPTLFFIFYDKNGKRRTLYGKEVIFLGDKLKDIAVIRVEGEGLESLVPTPFGVVGNEDDTPGEVPPAIRNVRIWAFDPFSLSKNPLVTPAMKRGDGAIFSPRTAAASRTAPVIERVQKNPRTGEEFSSIPEWRTDALDEDYHVFLDNVSLTLGHGNSGALITDEKAGKSLGVYVREVTPSMIGAPLDPPMQRHAHLRYWGNKEESNEPRIVPLLKNDKPLFNVGVSFSGILEDKSNFRDLLKD